MQTYVSDEIDATELLHKLSTYTKERAATEALWAALEESEKGYVASSLSFLLKGVYNLVQLSADDAVTLSNGTSILLQPPEDCPGFVGAVVSNKLAESALRRDVHGARETNPAWTLGQEENQYDRCQSEEDL